MAQKPEITGREILPIPDIPAKGKMALDARNLFILGTFRKEK
jgi:hypothetical protein